MFGYLLETDKMGFFKALAKAKEMFRSLYAEREYKNMMSDNFGSLEVNPEFVEMIEEIYYKEINTKAKIYDLRDKLIERFEGDERVYTENEAQKGLGISRIEMFKKLKENSLVWALSNKDNNWYILAKDRYREGVENKKANLNVPHFPLELVG